MAILRRDSPRWQLVRLFVALLRLAVKAVLALAGIVILALAWIALLLTPHRRADRPRLLWGTTPLKSLTYLSRALRDAGHLSESAVVNVYGITSHSDFDHYVLSRRARPAALGYVTSTLKAYMFFARALWRYDIFHYFFDGGVLRLTPLAGLELPFLKLCGKRIVLLPYGSDAFVYDHITDLSWRAMLMIDYGLNGDRAREIEHHLRRRSRHADVVVGCLVHIACLPRWDVLPLTCYPVDTDSLQPKYPRTEGPVQIVHPTNHRGTKGTEFLVAAVQQLQEDGHEVELHVIERMPNTRALELIAGADIFIDQLVFGYALAALEGLALGKVVISGLDDSPAYEPFRRYSYLNECPIVPAGPETIYGVLSDLLARREQWPEIGRRSRQYAERRHSPAAARELYGAIYRKIWDRENVDLINFYHPLFERAHGTDERLGPTANASRSSR
jgi:glycosyltransferase involved in cell wall biosynthesis